MEGEVRIQKDGNPGGKTEKLSGILGSHYKEVSLVTKGMEDFLLSDMIQENKNNYTLNLTQENIWTAIYN